MQLQSSQKAKARNVIHLKTKKPLTKKEATAIAQIKKSKIEARHIFFIDVISRLEGLDLMNIAKEADISHGALWAWVHGDVESPLFSNLVKVAKVLGLEFSMNELTKKAHKFNNRTVH